MKESLLEKALEVGFQQSQHISFAGSTQETVAWDPVLCPHPSCSTPVKGTMTWSEVVTQRRARRSPGAPSTGPSLALTNRFAALAQPEVQSEAQSVGVQHQPEPSRGAAVCPRLNLLRDAVLRRQSGGVSRSATAGTPPQSTQSGDLLCPESEVRSQHSARITTPPLCQPSHPDEANTTTTATGPPLPQRLPPPNVHIDKVINPECHMDVLPEQATQQTSSASDSAPPLPPPPRSLFSPTTLIVGDSIIRNCRFFNAVTHCLPGATVKSLLAKLPGLLQSAALSVQRVIIHIGTNDTTLRQSEVTKQHFKDLFNYLKACGKSVFISGLIPTYQRGSERFSRLLQLNSWLQNLSHDYDFAFIDNFNLFWCRPTFYKMDGLHPNSLGSKFLTNNIHFAIKLHRK